MISYDLIFSCLTERCAKAEAEILVLNSRLESQSKAIMALTQVKCGPVKEPVKWEATSPMSRLAVTNGVVRQLNCKSFFDSDFAKLSRVTPENQLKEEVAGKLLHEIEKLITFDYNFDERLNVHVMTGDVLIASIEKTNER